MAFKKPIARFQIKIYRQTLEHYSIVIFLMAVMIGLSAIADKIKLPYPILLISAGIAIGFIPSMPEVALDPEVIFLIFLPPLLYDAAYNLSSAGFKTHLNTIATLAFGLVFLTASGIAVVAHYMIPGMSWPLSFVLGAILSATDAVAAISITKGLGLSHKTLTILEGESLINDASALVTYRFAVAAVTGTAFVIWKASLEFVVLLGGGVLVGLIMAKLIVIILNRVRNDLLVAVSFKLLAPFVTYLIAEELHVSGVLAVVMLGFSISRFSGTVLSENLKLQAKHIWDAIIFMLNGLIFILIGLEFPYVIHEMEPVDLFTFIGYAAIISLVALLLRMGRVFLQRYNLQRAYKFKKSRIQEEALLDFKSSFIISWSGMRGIVSLAIALGLPATLENGDPFPQRNTIIFISVVVVLFTLIGQGLSLPWIVKKLEAGAVEK